VQAKKFGARHLISTQCEWITVGLNTEEMRFARGDDPSSVDVSSKHCFGSLPMRRLSDTWRSKTRCMLSEAAMMVAAKAHTISTSGRFDFATNIWEKTRTKTNVRSMLPNQYTCIWPGT
jgi:hypothetical protein